ncbi:MAG: GAF domain-containing protein [Chloroflexi bacterium]|nr:MAG: GAF domain-containing protein [Chloroflexota bacterium]
MWMTKRRNFMFKTQAYTNPLHKNQAIVLYMIVFVMVMFFSIYVFFLPMMDGTTLIHKVLNGNIYRLFGLVMFYLVTTLTYVALRKQRLDAAAWGVLAMWFFASNYNTVVFGYVNAMQGAELLLMIVLGGLVKGRVGIVATTLLSMTSLAVGIILRRNVTQQMLPDYVIAERFAQTEITSIMPLMLALFGTGILIYLFVYMNSVVRQVGAAEAVTDRMMVSEVLTQIAQKVAERAGLNALLNDIVERINAQFDFVYHVQVFLIDDTGNEARLVASTGAIGRQLLEINHKLLVGSVSVVGQVASRGNLIVAHAGTPDTIHRQNTLLPETQVEAAFPLRIGDKIIGVLDVQSKASNAFSDSSLLMAFQAMADSIALAIDNVSQFERAEARLKENQRLVEETRQALREVERLNERLTGRVWGEYLRGIAHDVGTEIDFENQQKNPITDWTTTLREALQINQLVQEQRDDAQVIAVPLRVRGRVIGAMEFELDKNNPFSPEDFDLLQEVSERFGMAVENARLVDESQRLAQREALVNQITSRLQAANSVNTMLNDAAASLRDALNASKVVIRLGTPPTPNGGGSS